MVRARTRLEEAQEDPELRQILELVPLAKDEVERRHGMYCFPGDAVLPCQWT